MELIRTADGGIKIEAHLGSREEHQDFNHRMRTYMVAFCGKDVRVYHSEAYNTVARIHLGNITFSVPPEHAVMAILGEVKRLYPTKYHKVEVAVSIINHCYMAKKGT